MVCLGEQTLARAAAVILCRRALRSDCQKSTQEWPTSWSALCRLRRFVASPLSGDGSPTVFGRFGDGHVLYWKKAGSHSRESAGTEASRAVLAVGAESGSLTLGGEKDWRKEVGHRNTTVDRTENDFETVFQ